MSKMNDDEWVEYVAKKVSKLFRKDMDDDECGYVAYLSFCILGSMIIDNNGPETFYSYVQEIAAKKGEK